MTHNQVDYLIGKRNAEISQQNADTRKSELDVKKEELDVSEGIADKNYKANRESQAIGTGIAVAAIVVSIIVACFW